MRKPKPTKIMVCTSWKPAGWRGHSGLLRLPPIHQSAILPVPPALTSQGRPEAGAELIKLPGHGRPPSPDPPCRAGQLGAVGPRLSLLSPGQSKRVEPSALFSAPLICPIPGLLTTSEKSNLSCVLSWRSPCPLCWKFSSPSGFS